MVFAWMQRGPDRAMISADGERYPFPSRPETDSPVRSRPRSSRCRLVRSALVVTLALAAPMAAGQLASSEPAPRAPTSHFVHRSGTKLTLNGKPFRFTGINIYMAASGGKPSSCGGSLYPDVGVPLSHMPSGIVFRFWAFQNFFVRGNSFDWTNFDRVLSIAAAHHDKVIPVLANQHPYCDGKTKTLAWYRDGYRGSVGPRSLLPFRAYAARVAQRYAGNPTIAMWQLVNEGQAVNSNGSCRERAAHQALLAFAGDVGQLVHGYDRNHLVSVGTPAGYSGSGHQWCGAANDDYRTLMASPGNDVCDFHDYGYPNRPMGQPFSPNLQSAIEMCHAVGKPIMVAENGIHATSAGALAPRAAHFRAKLNAQFAAGVAGDLLWAWAVKADYVVPADDRDYGIFPGDPSLDVLRSF